MFSHFKKQSGEYDGLNRRSDRKGQEWTASGLREALLPRPALGDNATMEAEPPEADPPKRKRRWFQFSLRTLLIGVTLLAVPCAYVGWQAKIVRERRVELSRVVDTRLVGIDGADKEGTIPWIRRALGDKRVGSIKMLVGTDAAELDRLRVLFPEAKVEVWTPAGSSVR
jgi:hypothetical protein